MTGLVLDSVTVSLPVTPDGRVPGKSPKTRRRRSQPPVGQRFPGGFALGEGWWFAWFALFAFSLSFCWTVGWLGLVWLTPDPDAAGEATATAGGSTAIIRPAASAPIIGRRVMRIVVLSWNVTVRQQTYAPVAGAKTADQTIFAVESRLA